MPIRRPKMSVFGVLRPLNIIGHCRDPQKALPCVKPRYVSHHALKSVQSFLADRTIGRAFATGCRLSVVCLSVCDVLYSGETVHLS